MQKKAVECRTDLHEDHRMVDPSVLLTDLQNAATEAPFDCA